MLVNAADTIWTLPVSVVGRECQPDSVTVDLAGDWQAFVRTSDRTEIPNWSCPSNVVYVTGNAPLSAPMPSAVTRRDYYDLAGRKVRNPTRSGVYWQRETRADGSRTRKLVVVR